MNAREGYYVCGDAPQRTAPASNVQARLGKARREAQEESANVPLSLSYTQTCKPWQQGGGPATRGSRGRPWKEVITRWQLRYSPAFQVFQQKRGKPPQTHACAHRHPLPRRRASVVISATLRISEEEKRDRSERNHRGRRALPAPSFYFSWRGHAIHGCEAFDMRTPVAEEVGMLPSSCAYFQRRGTSRHVDVDPVHNGVRIVAAGRDRVRMDAAKCRLCDVPKNLLFCGFFAS